MSLAQAVVRGAIGTRLPHAISAFHATSARWKFVEAGNAVGYHMIGLFLAAIDSHVWHVINILIIETADFDEHGTFHTGAARQYMCAACVAEIARNRPFEIITFELARLA